MTMTREQASEKFIVTITMEGGVIQDIDVPAGVSVVVWDYDTDGVPEDELETDGDGNKHITTVW